jgi:branched-chain amino acid transport system permease protein
MIIIVLGGLGSLTGTLVTSFVWVLILEGALRLVLPDGFETWRYVVYPLILLLVMLLRPKGLMGTYEFPFLRQVLPPMYLKNKAKPHDTQSPTSSIDSAGTREVTQ